LLQIDHYNEMFFFFSSRRRHTRSYGDWSSDVCSSDLAAKVMIDQKRKGKIINIASTSGHGGRKEATAYTTAKAGVLNLTRSIARSEERRVGKECRSRWWT